MQLPEEDLSGKWGLYSKARDRWIDVVFSTEREASEAADILNRAERKSELKRAYPT